MKSVPNGKARALFDLNRFSFCLLKAEEHRARNQWRFVCLGIYLIKGRLCIKRETGRGRAQIGNAVTERWPLKRFRSWLRHSCPRYIRCLHAAPKYRQVTASTSPCPPPQPPLAYASRVAVAVRVIAFGLLFYWSSAASVSCCDRAHFWNICCMWKTLACWPHQIRKTDAMRGTRPTTPDW